MAGIAVQIKCRKLVVYLRVLEAVKHLIKIRGNYSSKVLPQNVVYMSVLEKEIN